MTPNLSLVEMAYEQEHQPDKSLGWMQRRKLTALPRALSRSELRFGFFLHFGVHMKKVTSIGGIFFKARDPIALRTSYQKHLGIDVQDWSGAAFRFIFRVK
jgi:hypothetical protein